MAKKKPPPPPPGPDPYQRDLFAPEDVWFDGETYVHERDGQRLGAQINRVLHVMQDGEWRTLREISERTGDPEASISARIRDFRKDRFGKNKVDSEHIGHGLWRYRFIPNPQFRSNGSDP
ncbi:MAG TPA: hypothetical protein VKD00_07055 [Methyloceanibacter sp.]|nr:hypothetical protein [Methyloceanibacter sp.]